MSLITNLVKLQEVDSSIQSIQELQGDLLEKFKHFKNKVKKRLAIFKNKFIKLNLIENMMH